MTILHSQNFDSFANGATVPGWAGIFKPWDMSPGGAVSGVTVYTTIGSGSGAWCKYTDLGTRTQIDVTYKQKAVFSGADLGLLWPSFGDGTTQWSTFAYRFLLTGTASGVSCSFSPYLSSSFAGVLATGNRTVAITAGDIISVRIQVDGKVVSLWIWNETIESMPGSPTVTWTDTVQRPAGYFTVFGSTVAQAVAIGFDDLVISDISASGATAVTMSGPSGGYVGVASSVFSVAANGAITGTVIVTPSDGGGGGAFLPATVSISAATPSATFTYTPASAGTKTISATNNGGLSNPSSISYAATGIAAIPVDNSNLFWSPYSWDVLNAGDFSVATKSIQTNLSGSYLKFKFTGSSLLKIGIDPSQYSGFAAPSLPILMWSINNGPAQTAQLTGGTTELTLVTGLSTSSTHSVKFWVLGLTNSAGNRWGSPGVSPTNIVRITWLFLDSGGSVSAYGSYEKRAIIYGDSITEGHRSLRNGNINSLGMGRSLGWYIGESLGTEYTVAGFSGQDFGTSSPPALSTTWNQYSDGRSRSFSPAPDYVFSVMGSNNQASAAQVTSWITAVRAALGASTHIFVCVATSGTGSAAMISGVSAYAAANPTDRRAHLIDVRPEIPVAGMSVFGAATYFAEDGLHLDEKTQALWAASVVAKVAAIVAMDKPLTTKSITVNLVNASDVAQSSLSGLNWAWFDQEQPSDFQQPTDSGAAETTDGSGVLSINVRSALASGQVGWLIVTDSDGDPATAHKAFSGPVAVA